MRHLVHHDPIEEGRTDLVGNVDGGGVGVRSGYPADPGAVYQAGVVGRYLDDPPQASVYYERPHIAIISERMRSRSTGSDLLM